MFFDRKDAGEKLGQALEHYQDKDVLVLGIPSGGAETAYYVAQHLHADLAMVVTRKLGYPSNPEAAFGAIAEDGSLYISDMAQNVLSAEEMNEVLQFQKEEIKRRIQKLRKGKPLPELKDRIVIVVDDGIATGATLFATIELCRKRKAKKIVVAAPISGTNMKNKLLHLVDEVVILNTPEFYTAVSQGYENFSDLSDEEAMMFMDKWENNVHKEHNL